MNRLLASTTIAVLGMTIVNAPARGANFGITGLFQHRFERLSDFALDEGGTTHEQPYRNTMKARLGAHMSFSREFWISSTIQLLDGQVLGTDSPIPNGVRGEAWQAVPLDQGVQLRESILQVPVGVGVARIGRMPVHWGMGMVIHNGEAIDDPFDDPRGGDVVNGAWLDLKPLLSFSQDRLAHAIHLSLGGDLVEQDELSDRINGDLGWRVSGALTWEEPWLTGGITAMLRQVERENEDRAEHIVIDATFRYQARLADRFVFVTEAEAAVITGTTTSQTDDDIEQVRTIEQYGAVARLSLDDEAWASSYTLEVGYASGDSDVVDSHDTAFHFDPARRVGMILFDDVLARMSARDHQRLREEESTPVNPWKSPTNGAISNTLYIAPTLGLELEQGAVAFQAGGVIAFAPEPVFAARGSAGDETNLLGGEPVTGPLGYEVNTGASLSVDIESVVRFTLGTQYGLFVPGQALAAASPSQDLSLIHKWRLLADVTW